MAALDLKLEPEHACSGHAVLASSRHSPFADHLVRTSGGSPPDQPRHAWYALKPRRTKNQLASGLSRTCDELSTAYSAAAPGVVLYHLVAKLPLCGATRDSPLRLTINVSTPGLRQSPNEHE